MAVLGAHLKIASGAQTSRRPSMPGARQAKDGYHYVPE